MSDSLAEPFDETDETMTLLAGLGDELGIKGNEEEEEEEVMILKTPRTGDIKRPTKPIPSLKKAKSQEWLACASVSSNSSTSPRKYPLSARGPGEGIDTVAVDKEDPLCVSLKQLHDDAYIVLTHGRMQMDAAYSDLHITWELAAYKRQSVPVHIAILSVRCPLLLDEQQVITKIKTKKGQQVAAIRRRAIPMLTPHVLRELLYWVYTGRSRRKSVQLGLLLDLYQVGVILKVPHLVHEIRQRIRSGLSLKTVHQMLISVHSRGTNGELKEVKEMLFQFAFDNWAQFLGNKDGGRQLGIDLMQELTMMQTRYRTQRFPEGTRVSSGILQHYKLLCSSMLGADMYLQVASKQLPCHRVVLAARAPSLAAAVRAAPVTRDGAALTLGAEMTCVPAAQALLHFIYYADITRIDNEVATQLILHVTRKFGLEDLQQVCVHRLHVDTLEDALMLLPITYLPELASIQKLFHLRKELIGRIAGDFTQVNLAPILSHPVDKVRADLLFALQQRMRKQEAEHMQQY